MLFITFMIVFINVCLYFVSKFFMFSCLKLPKFTSFKNIRMIQKHLLSTFLTSKINGKRNTRCGVPDSFVRSIKLFLKTITTDIIYPFNKGGNEAED